MEAIAEASPRDSSVVITETDIAQLESQLRYALNEAVSESDGNWRQVGGGRVPGTYSGGHTPILQNQATLSDRQDGRFRPFYDNEVDLQAIRGKSRNLATFTSVAVGAVEALRVYTIGGQWKFEVQAKEGKQASPQLLCALQCVIDDVLEDNDFQGVYDQEIHDSARVDGEVLTAVYGTTGGHARIDVIDPDCLREPANKNSIERGLQQLGYASRGEQSWSFGVHTSYNPTMRRIDHSRPIGYHLVYDDTGRDWDYLPAFPVANAGRISNRCLLHLKCNAPVGVKRGVSDFYPIQEVLERKHILGRNLAVGAAIQAAIAYIRHHKGPVTRDQVVQHLSRALDTASRDATANRTDGRSQQNFTPGTVVDTSAEYHAAPLGSTNTDIFMEVCAYLMRCAGVRWLMPEYIISGDASNANFASTLVAESPFVKAREADQRTYVAYIKRILWAAIKIAYDAGRFGGCVRTWQELRGCIDLMVTPPRVATTDKQQQLEESKYLYDEKLISKNDLLADMGRDTRPGWDDEFSTKQAASPMFGGPVVGGNPSVVAARQAAVSAALESATTIDEARTILESLQHGDEK